jgi:surface antigen
MRRTLILPAVAAAALLAGCQTGPGQTIGTIGGAAAGGAIGSQIGEGTGQLIATGAGTILGALAGGMMGAQFDQQDYYASNQATQQALSTGQTATWQGPNAYGTMTPTSQTFYQGGRECRNFAHTVYVGGQPQQRQGLACRAPNGTWQIVDTY